jgi:hypothetical protein
MKKLCLISVVLVSIGCEGAGPNRHGMLGASKTGDLSVPAAPRERFDAQLRATCGDAPSDAPPMVRDPYVQRLNQRSAALMWTAPLPPGMGVTLEREDDTVVDVVPSELDERGQHVAELEGLEPSTTYCWSVRGPDGELVSRGGFESAPEPGRGEEVRFVVVGDMGSGSSDQYAVRDQITTVPFDLMLTVGDNAYEDGTLAQFEQNFFAVYRDIFRWVSVFPTLGNHDYNTDDGAPYRQVFALPENGGPEGLERWYSFDWGDVHFVALDTMSLGSAQLAWLDTDLAANELPWVIVYGHHPPYSSGGHGSDLATREVLAPIFRRHRVPVYLAGHDHHYERTVSIDETVYVVTGGGGKGTRETGSSSFTAHSDEVLHFVWGRVAGDVLELHAIDANGTEFDSVAITRPL